MGSLHRLRAGSCLVVLFAAVLGAVREAHAFSYVALGDSLAVGAGDAGGGGYVARYLDDLAADLQIPVALQNLAVGGTTSQDLLATLTSDGAVRAAVAAADVVTFDIGGNDVLIALFAFAGGTCGGTDGQDCLRLAVSGFETNWPAILTELRTLNPGALMRTMTYYNPVIGDLMPGDGTAVAMKPYIDGVNATIRTATPAFGIGIAEAAIAFNGVSGKDDPIPKGYLDSDHIHPSLLGYHVLGEGFHALGYEPIPGTLVRIASSLALRDDATAPVDPAKRRLSLTTSTKKAPPGNRIVPPRPGGPQDPRTAGAEILVYNATGATSDRTVIALPAAGWSLVGEGYRYKGTGAVTQVQVASDRLKLKGKGAGIDYSLDEPTQGSVALRLTFGGGSFCASASAATSGNPPSTAKSDRPGKFVGMKKAPAPIACPPDLLLATPTPMATPTPTITPTPGDVQQRQLGRVWIVRRWLLRARGSPSMHAHGDRQRMLLGQPVSRYVHVRRRLRPDGSLHSHRLSHLAMLPPVSVGVRSMLAPQRVVPCAQYSMSSHAPTRSRPARRAARRCADRTPPPPRCA